MIQNSQERLDKVLANSGFGTRKDVKRLIRSGAVKVNGEIANSVEQKIDLNHDKICVDGKDLEIFVNAYFVMNKPRGYVCSTKSDSHETVMSLLKSEDSRKYLGGCLSMVGRLDLDTEGLLIITSDGQLNHRLTFPKYNVSKTYLVYLKNPVDENHKKIYSEQVAKGVHIEAEGKASEADCKGGILEWKNERDFKNLESENFEHLNAENFENQNVENQNFENENADFPNAVCLITLFEGMFHEVKRIFKALGNEVVYLKRIKMNDFSLPEDLMSGEYRTLTNEELKLLVGDDFSL